MANLASLKKQIADLRKQFEPGVKHWHISMVEGYDLPEDLRKQFGPHDLVVIREIQAGYMDDLVDERGVFYAWNEEQFSHNNFKSR